METEQWLVGVTAWGVGEEGGKGVWPHTGSWGIPVRMAQEPHQRQQPSYGFSPVSKDVTPVGKSDKGVWFSFQLRVWL